MKPQGFYPFYDPYRGGDTLGYPAKIGISSGIGALYLLLSYYSLPDKMVFFQQYSWVLGIVISTSLLALYIATDVFRRSMEIMNEFESDSRMTDGIIENWLPNKWYLLAGFSFATLNTSIAHILGVPAEFHATVFSLTMAYIGFFAAGFCSGMGLHGIFTIIVLHLRFTPNLQHSLDPDDPDGNGGIKKLGDALWFFGMLIGSLGILISIYMFGVSWTSMYKPWVQVIFLLWVTFPYIVAISVVLIPGLAVRRQVSHYKTHRADQLKQEKAQLYASYKHFDENDDEEIIGQKKELSEKMEKIQEQMEKLRAMRSSHIDGKE